MKYKIQYIRGIRFGLLLVEVVGSKKIYLTFSHGSSVIYVKNKETISFYSQKYIKCGLT